MSTNDTLRGLLPCPFCGGAVHFHKDDECDGCHYIECLGCKGMFDLATKADPENRAEALVDLQSAIAVLWNRRALAEPVSGVAEVNSEAGLAEWAEGKFGAGGSFRGQLCGNTDWALARLVWSAALQSAALNGGAVAGKVAVPRKALADFIEYSVHGPYGLASFSKWSDNKSSLVLALNPKPPTVCNCRQGRDACTCKPLKSECRGNEDL